MSTKDKERIELLQGTLDLLILRTLLPGPAHGHAIAKTIEFNSADVLQVEQGSLYPALHRLSAVAGFLPKRVHPRTIAAPSSIA
jgi:PadR family transcriptional regulator PadR